MPRSSNPDRRPLITDARQTRKRPPLAPIARLLALCCSTLACGTPCLAEDEYLCHTTPDDDPFGLAYDEGSGNLWSIDRAAKRVYSIDSQTGEAQHIMTFGSTPRSVALGNNRIWLMRKTKIYKLDPASMPAVPTDEFPVGAPFVEGPGNEDEGNEGIAYGGGFGGFVWVSAGDSIYQYHNAAAQFVGKFEFDFQPRGLAYHDGSLWALDNGADLLHRIDPSTGEVTRTWPVYSGTLRGLAAQGDRFWICENGTATVTRYAPQDEVFSDIYVPPTRFKVWGVTEGDGIGSWEVPYISSGGIEPTNTYPDVRRIVLSLHGAGSEAEGHFRRALAAAKLADPTGGIIAETLIIAPQFIKRGEVMSADKPDDHKLKQFDFINADAPDELAAWEHGGRFWGARSKGNIGISSFDAADALLKRAVALCPKVEQIVVTGHSGGGQFTHRYAALSRFEDLDKPVDCAMRYIVMNPGNYCYFGDKRYDPDTLDLDNGIVEFVKPWTVENGGAKYGVCGGFLLFKLEMNAGPKGSWNRYGRGVRSFTDPDHPLKHSYAWEFAEPDDAAKNARERYRQRCVVYLIGEDDNDVRDCDDEDSSIPIQLGDMLQGRTRFDRARIFWRHLLHRFGADITKTHTIAQVPGVGHSSLGMFTSEEGVDYIFKRECDPLDGWMAAAAGAAVPPRKRRPEADLDGDGVPNGMERAFGTAPHIPDRGGHPRVEVRARPGGAAHLVLSYHRDTSVDDVELLVEGTTDLRRWIPVRETVSVVPLGGGIDEVTVRHPLPLGSHAGQAGALRLRLIGRPGAGGCCGSR